MYYGSKNKQELEDVCPHCQNRARLTSYETRKFFVIFYIPIIPIERLQILNQCARCQRHHAINFEKWKRVQEESIREVSEKIAAQPGTPEGALELLGTLTGFQRYAEAEALADELSAKYSEQFAVQYQLGAWYEQRKLKPQSDACFAQCLKLDPESLPAKRAVGIGKIEDGELDAARTLLAPFAPGMPDYAPPVMFLLARGYQQAGRHEDALDLYEELIAHTPDFVKDRDFCAAVRRSEAATQASGSMVPRRRLSDSPLFKLAIAAGLLISALAFYNSYRARHRGVYFVNPLVRPISVVVDDRPPFTLRGPGQVKVDLPEGPHRMRASIEGVTGFTSEERAFTVTDSFFPRLFALRTFVADPLGAAIVMNEEIIYSAKGDDRAQPKVLLHLGQPLLTISGVDYAFVAAPQTLKVKSSSVTRRRVSLAPMPAVNVLFWHLSGTSPAPFEGDALEFCRCRLLADPEDKMLLYAYTSTLDRNGQADAVDTLIRANLNVRPVLVEWHRQHQNREEAAGRGDALLAEYEKLLATEPTSGGLLYLRGRLEHGAKAVPWFERAVEADPTLAVAWSARAWQSFLGGDVAVAMSGITRAIELAPSDIEFNYRQFPIRMAAKDYERLAGELRPSALPPDNSAPSDTIVLELIQALVALERFDDVQGVLEAYRLRLPPDEAAPRAARIQAHVYYYTGQLDKLPPLLDALSDERNLWTGILALEQGRLDDVPAEAKLLPIDSETAPWTTLCRALAARVHGNHAAAEALETAAGEQFSKGDRNERLIAEFLENVRHGEPFDHSVLELEAVSKSLLLALAADRVTDQQSEILSLAETLNSNRDFPHRLIAQQIETLRAAAPAQ